MSFLSGDSEMARRIRNFDWTDHPIGHPEDWPQSLRAALGICLNSAFPTAIYWGPELRLLYNDAWSTIPGPRHPACLGEPAHEVWSDIWHVIEPQFFEVIETGEGLFLDDQMLPMKRYGIEEETYWSYSFTPIRDADGAIVGIFNSGQETTAKVIQQRQTAFLLKVHDAIRELGEAALIMKKVCEMLADHLGAIRVGIRELGSPDEPFPISVEWTAEGIRPAGQEARWSTLGTIAAELTAGHVIRVTQVSQLEDVPTRDFLTDLGAAAVVAVPAFQASRLSAVLFVHRAEPHAWFDEEIATIEQVLALARQLVEQQRNALREKAMLREIDHRARNLLGITQALVRLTRGDDMAAYKASLLDRMQSLGNTLGILSAAKWVGASFEDLLRSELEPFLANDAANVTLEGAPMIVRPEMAQPIAMAIHELATNAVKYGALGNADGHLVVSWTVEPSGSFTITWREQKKRPGNSPQPETPGFGTQLLSLTIERQLQGRIERTVTDTTFECILEIPLPPAE